MSVIKGILGLLESYEDEEKAAIYGFMHRTNRTNFSSVPFKDFVHDVAEWHREQSEVHKEEMEIVEEYRKSSAKEFESPYGMTEHVKKRDELIERLGKLRLNELLMNESPQRTGGR